MNTLNIDNIFGRAWQLAKKYWGWLLLLSFVNYMTGQLVNAGTQPNAMQTAKMISAMAEGNQDKLTELLLANQAQSIGFSMVIGLILSGIISCFITMITLRVVWAAVHEEKIDLTQQIKSALNFSAIKFIGIELVYGIAIFGATLCCILPGIYFGVRLMFVPLVAATHPDMSFGEVFSRSMRLTKGHFWTLVGYGIVCMIINIIGLLCCCVGVLYSSIVTELFVGETYRILDAIANEEDGFTRDAEPIADETAQSFEGDHYEK